MSMALPAAMPLHTLPSLATIPSSLDMPTLEECIDEYGDAKVSVPVVSNNF
jgi:hypothetical protein